MKKNKIKQNFRQIILKKIHRKTFKLYIKNYYNVNKYYKINIK